MLHAAFVRSPEAHARIASIDASAALARDGSTPVYTGKDVDLESGLPLAWGPPGVEVKAPEHWPLAKEVAKHVGDPVAVVIGEDRYAVVDAAEDVLVEYDPLPVVPTSRRRSGTVRSSTTTWARTRCTSGRSAATSSRRSRRRRWSSSAASSTTAPPARRSRRAGSSPTTAPAT
jgi:xanthine dehydrogenase molybdopterin-binding subunit B